MLSVSRGSFLRGLLVVSLLAVSAATVGVRQARAQTPNDTIITALVGWNLMAFGGTTSYANAQPSALTSPLYTWQPGDTNYQTTDLQHLVAGQAYWLYFSSKYSFPVSNANSLYRAVTVAAGQCVMLGNPSAKAAARVAGADAVSVFSTYQNTYLQQTLVPIGRGAWACNRSAVPENVTISDQGDVVPFTSSALLPPSPYNGDGKAQLTISNDSPYPLVAANVRVGSDGNLVANDQFDLAAGAVPACTSCPEYTTGQHNCSPSAQSATVGANPGTQELHIIAEGRNVPDYLGTINLQPNMAYTICVWVAADRPQRNLP
jgi:hypothetical protein